MNYNKGTAWFARNYCVVTMLQNVFGDEMTFASYSLYRSLMEHPV